MPHLIDLHRHTPTVTACDPRGLPVLSIGYHRLVATKTAETRMERLKYDAAGRLCAQWDARLWADGGDTGKPNQRTVYDFSNRALRTENADAGWRMQLPGDTGQAREGWDGRGTCHWIGYDEQLRPLELIEQMDSGPPRCIERFTYGTSDEGSTNRGGRLIRHDDPAGSVMFSAYSLSGRLLGENRHFLDTLEAPDWPATMADRDGLLETDAQASMVGYTTRWQYDALGVVWRQTDAAGHVLRTYADVAGRAVRTDFQPWGGTAQTVARDIAYDAFGHAITETAGNGVMTRTTWSAADGRLRERQVTRPGHVLQDVDYTYDPKGNVIRIEDRAQPTTWFDGAQIDPVDTYVYDTLYQLIEASGRESVQACIGRPLPGLVVPGGGIASRCRRYLQTYSYDAAGNMRTLSHTASDGIQYVRTMKVAARSNRSLYQPPDAPPPDVEAAFDGNGNLQRLGGSTVTWDARNQLQRVTLLVRAGGENDEETYVYDGAGARRRKVRRMQGRAVTHEEEVRYLPGLEHHRKSVTGEAWEVATISAGHASVRWLRWQVDGRKDSVPPQWRYSIVDHVGSSVLELDGDADVVSHEGYYPFGGTAWWAARSEVDATHKTIRYSGKERDASGLYYFGFRYYAPWLCRWINPDPAGDIGGLNRYRMAGNDPIGRVDARGLIDQSVSAPPEWIEVGRSADLRPSASWRENEAHGGTDLRPGALWGDSEAMRDPVFGYSIPNLAHRLEHRDELSGNGARFVNGNEFTHDTNLTNDIMAPFMNDSTVVSSPAIGDDIFRNAYTPTEWTFKMNFKNSRSGRYFANDVARAQYKIAAGRNGFFGVLPAIIRREHVVNPDTLTRTNGLASRSQELYRTFLENTPNGKTTQRILDDFGLQATSVVREDAFLALNPETGAAEEIRDSSGLASTRRRLPPGSTTDFVVYVKPAPGTDSLHRQMNIQPRRRGMPY
ncbi:RHS repeat-associated core domain-containing protein [Luteibacter yeojuensis]